MLGYKLLAILFQFTRWDHRSCSYCHFLSWTPLSRKVPAKPQPAWEHQLWQMMVAIGSHWSREVLIFLFSPSDSLPCKTWVWMNSLFNAKKKVILQEFMILIRLMLSTQALFSNMLRVFPQSLKWFSQSSWVLGFSVALYLLFILELRKHFVRKNQKSAYSWQNIYLLCILQVPFSILFIHINVSALVIRVHECFTSPFMFHHPVCCVTKLAQVLMS